MCRKKAQLVKEATLQGHGRGRGASSSSSRKKKPKTSGCRWQQRLSKGRKGKWRIGMRGKKI